MPTPAQFWPEALPWAQQVHSRLPVMFVSVVLAQWASETGYGGYDWSVAHNPGNVGSFDGRPVNTFPNLQTGVDAYIQTLQNGYYRAVLAATTWSSQCYALGNSPWASGHYEAAGPPPGEDLIKIVNANNLTQYDGSQPTPTPTPKPPPAPPKEYKIMDSAVAQNGDIVSHAVTPAGHYLEITRKAGKQGLSATDGLSIIDITAQYPGFVVQP